MKINVPYLSSRKTNGFALVATISVMVLLVLVALAMLSLATVELRQKDNNKFNEEARANARLALMMALGDLQQHAGADRRVTAPASILSDSIDPRKRNWTTVWNTATWDVKEPAVSRDNNSYLKALVSRGDASLPNNRADAVSDMESPVPVSDDSWIKLVGPGSVTDTDDEVYAEMVDVSQGNSQGGYAYWVGDESVKARVDITPSQDAPSNTWITAGRLSGAPGTGIHKIEGLSDYTSYLPSGANTDQLNRFLSTGTFQLSDIDSNNVKEHFHNVTTSHVGLLVDNRLGGIRRDLSMAFEIDTEEFGEIEEFNNSGESNQTQEYSNFVPSDATTNPLYYHEDTDQELGYLYQVPVDTINRFRGPTWDILRNHYRLYKKERNFLNFRGLPIPSDDALVAHGVVPFSYTGSLTSPIGASLGGEYVAPNRTGTVGAAQYPFVSAHGVSGGHDGKNSNRIQPTVQKITPELIRSVLVFGLARQDNDYFFTATPYFTFHNPYNYPIEFYSLGVDLRGIGSYIDFQVTYNNQSGVSVTQGMEFEVGNIAAVRDLLSFRLTAPANGTYRLEPGEIKLMSMQPNTTAIGAGENSIRLTDFTYYEENGIVKDLGISSNVLNVQEDSEMTMRIRTTAQSTLGSIFARLYHPERATGGAYALDDLSNFSGGNSASQNRHADTEDLSLIKNMKILPYVRTYDGASEVRTFNESQVTPPDEGFLALFVMDMGMKTFEDDVAVLGDFNYRSLGLDPRDYDSEDVLAPNWKFDITPLGDYSELQLTDNLDGGAYWGSSHQAGSGQSNLVLFDLPRAPSVSLASLQHADTSILNFHPMRSIANSRPQVGQEDLTNVYNQLDRVRESTPGKYQIDTSWASNEMLWDRYYYSGINWGDSLSDQPYTSQQETIQAIIDGDFDRVFANSRIVLTKPVTSSDLEDLTGEQAYAEIGNFLGINGAFNVNSTSVEAWKAVLASLSGHEIDYLSGANTVSENLGNGLSPISRFSTPAGDETDDHLGFRALDDTELQSLAEAIVEQVKLRGPFMGLSDFVNRRLLADETGESGAIQAAIDSTNLNNSVAEGLTNDAGLRQSAKDANEGIARHFSQGDVLTVLSPIITTRSDTFIVRTYGDSKDANGNIRAKAWCEAIVQRTPEWVVPTDEQATRQNPDYPEGNSTDSPVLKKWEENPDLPDACQKYGRKFKIISFRWLSQSEV